MWKKNIVKMIELHEYLTWNNFLGKHAKYVISVGFGWIEFLYTEREVIDWLHERKYRWRDVTAKGNGEWETKDGRFFIRQIKVKKC